MNHCTRCRGELDVECPHDGSICCACAELEIRQLFGMLEDGWPDRAEVDRMRGGHGQPDPFGSP